MGEPVLAQSVSTAPLVIRHGFGEWSSENAPKLRPASNLSVCPNMCELPSQLTTRSRISVPCLHPHLWPQPGLLGSPVFLVWTRCVLLARPLRSGLTLPRYASPLPIYVLPGTEDSRNGSQALGSPWFLPHPLLCPAPCPLPPSDSYLFNLASAPRVWDSSSSKSLAPGVIGASNSLLTGQPLLGVPKVETKRQGEQGFKISIKVGGLPE